MIQDLLDKAIKEDREKERVSSGKFHVSDSLTCRLKRYWKRQGRKLVTEIDDRTFRVFEAGKWFERGVLDTIRNSGIQVIEQVPCEDENRKGFMDAILVTDTERQVLLELKSMHSRAFWWREKSGDWIGDRHHRGQILTYEKMSNIVFNKLILCYVSKDDLCLKEVVVSPTMMEREAIDVDWEVLITCWDKKVEPKANPQDWECQYCGYMPECPQKITKEKIAGRSRKK